MAFSATGIPRASWSSVEGHASRAAPRAGAAPAYERAHLLSFPGSAYVKIAEGCANRCTYCAIPLIRGELASRSRRRSSRRRRAPRPRHPGAGPDRTGPRLLREGSRRRPGCTRSACPSSPVSGRFLGPAPLHPSRPLSRRSSRSSWRGDPRFLPYFDLPFQHAAPGILRAMGRRSDLKRNLALVEEIREPSPGRGHPLHLPPGLPR